MPYGIHADVREASTLPSRFYTDPVEFERSKDLIFARSWQWLGDSDMVKVPGQVAPITLLEGCLDEPLVLTRDMNDQVHCLSNVCTHRGNLVCEGMSNERFLRCRYHGKRFGLDGAFQAMPEFEQAANFPSDADNLPRIPFAEWFGHLFAAVSPVASLEEWLAPMTNRIGWMPIHQFVHEPSRARDYMVRAHWALYVDNYLEGFHIPFIHADLNAAIDYGNYTNELERYLNLQLAVGKNGEDAFDLPANSPDMGKNISAYYYWVFPNLMFNFYPWGLSVNVIKPLAYNLTKVSFIPFVWDSSKVGRGAGAALDRVEREDEAVVEMVQKGLRSRFYDRGRYSPAREAGVHHFHGLIQEFMSR